MFPLSNHVDKKFEILVCRSEPVYTFVATQIAINWCLVRPQNHSTGTTGNRFPSPWKQDHLRDVKHRFRPEYTSKFSNLRVSCEIRQFFLALSRYEIELTVLLFTTDYCLRNSK